MSHTPARPWTLVDILIVLVILLAGNIIGPVLVFLWVWWSHTPWRQLGLVRPNRWVVPTILAVVTGILFKLGMKTFVMPRLGFPAINPAYLYLRGNRAALPGMLFTVLVSAGFGEELIWRGFLFDRLRAFLGPRLYTRTTAVVISAMLFGLAHFADQGIAGVAQSTITGLVFGAAYAITGELWWPIIVHAAFDVTAVLLIYWAK